MDAIEKQLRAWSFNTVPAGDFWSSFPFIVPLDRLVGDQENRYEAYLRAAFAKPYILGYFKCQYADQVLPTGMLKEGLLEIRQGPVRKEFAEMLSGIHHRLRAQLESENRMEP